MALSSLIGHIFYTTIIPILILFFIGVILDRKFHLDIYTLSKLLFYVLMPAYVFSALYTAPFDESTLGIVACAIGILIMTSLSSHLIGRLCGFSRGKTEIFTNCIMFNNAGNVGVAVTTFVYSNAPFVIDGTTPYLKEALLSVVAIIVIQNLTSNTVGFYQAGQGKYTLSDCVKIVFKMPTVYVAPTAILLRQMPFTLTDMAFWPALELYGHAFVGIAMIILGAQINRTPLNFFKWDVLLASGLRLLVGPMLAILAVLAWQHWFAALPVIAAQALIITYSVPTSINQSLIAYEMDNHPEFATQIVMATAILSSFTMPFAILAAYYLFPFTG